MSPNIVQILQPATGVVAQAPADSEPSEFRIDPARSRVVFTIRHMTHKVRGELELWSGSIRYDSTRPELTTVAATIAASSIRTANEIRDARLRGVEFFDSDSYPYITFVSRGAGRWGTRLEVVGDLTIRGATRRLTLNVTRIVSLVGDPDRPRRMAASAHAEMRRSDFGIGFGAALETGGVLIGDRVRIELEIEMACDARAR